jgi:hypothetical protein
MFSEEGIKAHYVFLQFNQFFVLGFQVKLKSLSLSGQEGLGFFVKRISHGIFWKKWC